MFVCDAHIDIQCAIGKMSPANAPSRIVDAPLGGSVLACGTEVLDSFSATEPALYVELSASFTIDPTLLMPIGFRLYQKVPVALLFADR